jgi:hypothetical protein
MQIKQLDHVFLGFLLGVIAPSIAILIFYYLNFSTSDLGSFLNLSVKEKLLSPLLSLCLIVNLGVFYLFIHFEKLFSARGVILATFLFGFIIVLLKFFL